MLILDQDDPTSILITGYTITANFGKEIIYAKFSNMGELLLYQRQGCALDDEAVSMALDRHLTSIFVLGHSNCYIPSETHLMMHKLDA
jgi:hypothetical protein